MQVSGIPEGEGATGMVDGRPVAVYNDGGSLIVLQNICTHMGCQTSWNAEDHSWDCPCHGSRYNSGGEVIHGPAPDPLPRLEYHIEGDELKID